MPFPRVPVTGLWVWGYKGKPTDHFQAARERPSHTTVLGPFSLLVGKLFSSISDTRQVR